ncbi:MAG: hypothetical protein M3457_12315 [Chloroflexota bacterium]|nr:hypothetical protein [Chloroflexota bacterium]
MTTSSQRGLATLAEEAQAVTISESLRLHERFIREAIDDTDRLDQIPDGAVLIILPSDNAELASRALAKAEQLRAEGRSIHLEQVGPELPNPSPWWIGERTPAHLKAWIPAAESLLSAPELTIVYDHQRDLLFARWDDNQRDGLAWPLQGGSLVLVDTASNLVFALIVPNFMAAMVPLIPPLASVVALAEIRALSQAEVGDFQLPAALSTITTLRDRVEPLSESVRVELIAAISKLTGESKARFSKVRYGRPGTEGTATLG